MSQLGTLVQWGLLFVGWCFFCCSPQDLEMKDIDVIEGRAVQTNQAEPSGEANVQQEWHTQAAAPGAFQVQAPPPLDGPFKHSRVGLTAITVFVSMLPKLLHRLLAWLSHNRVVVGALLILSNGGWSVGAASSGFVTTDDKAVLMFSRYIHRCRLAQWPFSGPVTPIFCL